MILFAEQSMHHLVGHDSQSARSQWQMQDLEAEAVLAVIVLIYMRVGFIYAV